MNTNLLKEGGIVLVLGALVVLVANPTGMWMPMVGEALLVGAIVVVVALFATLYWREQAHDERETQLYARSGRIAFMIGSLVLTLGIVIEFVSMHYANPWLLGALFAMVAAKACANMYNDYYL